MGDYVLITDSACDLSDEMAGSLGVEVIPMTFTLGGKNYLNYLDGRQLSYRDFYNKLRDGESATTSALNLGEFTDFFQPFLHKGSDILYIAFSSGLSSTCDAAGLAAKELIEKYPERKVLVVDSLCASMGQGLLIYLAANKKNSGASIEEVRDYAESTKFSLAHWFTVNDLSHLKRGGRISGTTAFVGTLLGIKPVMNVDNEGHLQNVEKARGRKGAISALIEKIEQAGEGIKDQVIFISHGDCEDEVTAMAEDIKKRFGVSQVVLSPIGPVIGAHSGPGTIALFFLAAQR